MQVPSEVVVHGLQELVVSLVHLPTAYSGKNPPCDTNMAHS